LRRGRFGDGGWSEAMNARVMQYMRHLYLRLLAGIVFDHRF